MRILAAVLLCAAAAAAQGDERSLDIGGGKTLRYELVEPGGPLPSAIGTAREVLGRLAAGDIVEAAALSNSPLRRHEVLRDYLSRVGEEEFKRVFSQYASPENRVLAEIAIGRHRLIIWNLAEPQNHLAGQYYVEVDGRFLMDDVPNETRANLRRVLRAYRRDASPSARTD